MTTLAELLTYKALALKHVSGDFTCSIEHVRLLPEEKAWLTAYDLRLSDTLELLPPYPHTLGLTGKATPSLIEKAQALGVTLFEIPEHTRERVRETALACLARHQAKHVTQSLSVHSYLLTALHSSKPERQVLTQLAKLSGGTFLLLGAAKQLQARAGPLGIRASLLDNALQLPEGRYPLKTHEAMLLRLQFEGRLGGVLIAVDVPPEYEGMVHLARHVLMLALMQRQLIQHHHDVLRASLLSEWLAGVLDGGALQQRFMMLGLDSDSQYALAVAGLIQPHTLKDTEANTYAELLKRAGDAHFADLGAPYLSSIRFEPQPHCVWFFSGANAEAQVITLHTTLTNALPFSYKLGISHNTRDYSTAALSTHYYQALHTMQSLAEGAQQYNQPDPVSWLLKQQPSASLHTMYHELLGRVIRADKEGKLLMTLRAYMHHSRDINALAEQLNVHPNTLRYRLGKLEHLLGLPIDKPETLAKLYVAFRIDDTLNGKG